LSDKSLFLEKSYESGYEDANAETNDKGHSVNESAHRSRASKDALRFMDAGADCVIKHAGAPGRANVGLTISSLVCRAVLAASRMKGNNVSVPLHRTVFSF
jgi:hypothetical protein